MKKIILILGMVILFSSFVSGALSNNLKAYFSFDNTDPAWSNRPSKPLPIKEISKKNCHLYMWVIFLKLHLFPYCEVFKHYDCNINMTTNIDCSNVKCRFINIRNAGRGIQC